LLFPRYWEGIYPKLLRRKVLATPSRKKDGFPMKNVRNDEEMEDAVR
jgi:hypothetical protein